jgi:hypothetical protein
MGILDQYQYPWHEPAARQLHDLLISLYPNPQAALLLAAQAGIDVTWINSGQAIAPLWKDILEAAAGGARLRALVGAARDRLHPEHPARAFLDDLLADAAAPVAAGLLGPDQRPPFLHDDDTVTEPEALLFRDDLTVPVGRLPGLIATLERLAELAPGVCKLSVRFGTEEQYGTAFRIGRNLLLTNWHVVHRLGGAIPTAITAEFGFEDDQEGRPLSAYPVPCEEASVVADQADDWALVRATWALDPAWPALPLAVAAKPVTGGTAFIIQHPLGQRKRVGFVRNQVSYVDDRVVQYLTDTDTGSSGSPVLDEAGRLIALHHSGGRPRILLGRPPLRKNEGIRISRVAAGLADYGIAIA